MADFVWKGVPLKRLEEMLIFIAKVVDMKGPIAQPLLDRIESEYMQAVAAQQQGSQADRVRKLIGAKRDTFSTTNTTTFDN